MSKKTLLSLSFLILFVAACASIRAMSDNGLFAGESERSETPNERALRMSGQNTKKFFGFWDHPALPDSMAAYVNVGKSLSADDTRTVTRHGLPAIPIITGFREGDSPDVWRKRLRDKSSQLPDPEVVPFVLLIDEPYGKGFDDKKLELLIDIAREEMPGHKFAYTVMTLTILNRPQRRLPQNADYIGINYYPFRTGSNIATEQRFQRDMNRLMTAARKKINTRFFIVGQAFYEDEKWRQPPAEAPFWYARAVAGAEDIDGLLWFEWRNRGNWQGVGSMPEFRENLIKAGSLFVEKDASF